MGQRRAPIATKIELAKQAEDLCSGGLDQRIVYEACRRGVLARQLPLLRAHYQHKRDVMVQALKRSLAGVVTWPDPRGGFFLWARLARAAPQRCAACRSRRPAA